MARLESVHPSSVLTSVGDELRERTRPMRRHKERGISPGLLIAGVAVIGLGWLAWNYLGPDLKRYMKIQSM
jgi:hypothetical protein